MKNQFTFSILGTMVLLIFFGSLIYAQVPGTLYGTTGSTTNQLITIDPTTGAGTLVAPISGTGSGVTEIEFRNDEVLFGTVGGGITEVVTIDPLTGVATIIGLHAPASAVAGLDFDSGGNLLGALYVPGTTTDLVTIDQTTGASTVVGTIFPGGIDRVTGLTFDAGGTLYGSVHQQGPSSLYTINPTTGVPTLVGPIGFDRVGSIEFGPDGILYGGVGGGPNAGDLISINPSTGAGTLIGSTGFPAISGLSFFPGVIPGACGLFEDTFDADIAQWTPVGPLGLTNWSWQATNNAAGVAPGEMQFSWTPSFTGDSYIMSPVVPSGGWANTTISFEHFVDYFGAGLTVGCATTTDAGATWTTIWEVVDPPGNVGPENVTVPFTGDDNLQFGFFYSGNSFQIDFWYIDDVCVDGIVPVELTSFTASVNDKNVTLNWTTATEINNQGFEIERNSGNGFQNVGYVAGFGTSAEPHSYSFTDASVNEGTHSYRLKQLDFDGSFEYFDAIEVEVAIPDVFALEQNYPNPFNPSTKINFSLAVDSDVSLKVFDVLGQEVATLINTNLVAGSHNVDFNASLLNSGVYFYRIEATGIDGTNFTNVKKMILTK